ncbi:unnamed protein product [Paramecium primaurelia]|uniref:Uncharacterized protein n=1 Tax=Paramecium primaurelia TaxID=5886 RepID=A0A8S1MXL6_PARPR|nr:unnamed protein product [Paramecium primaurelia]
MKIYDFILAQKSDSCFSCQKGYTISIYAALTKLILKIVHNLDAEGLSNQGYLHKLEQNSNQDQEIIKNFANPNRSKLTQNIILKLYYYLQHLKIIVFSYKTQEITKIFFEQIIISLFQVKRAIYKNQLFITACCPIKFRLKHLRNKKGIIIYIQIC